MAGWGHVSRSIIDMNPSQSFLLLQLKPSTHNPFIFSFQCWRQSPGAGKQLSGGGEANCAKWLPKLQTTQSPVPLIGNWPFLTGAVGVGRTAITYHPGGRQWAGPVGWRGVGISWGWEPGWCSTPPDRGRACAQGHQKPPGVSGRPV
ncbi:hypothetical protein HJG60_012061 [Phyllostomus discolor]|uniref:Uncharacterized protein n=1 Tax=Phyllostomus discolor TaxID=89673 RepID=A0A834DWQ1_9CHIR|nr:hypothetical protein HJG60_012061 [Phyllostomus discolor]